MSDKLKAVLDKINKTYGVGSVSMLGDAPTIQVEAFSTGSLGLDICTGVGGFPRGRITEIYGTESSGKTTCVLQAIADCQRKGGIAAIVDAEQALDPTYAKSLGVDFDKLVFSQPNSAEEALNIAEELIVSGEIDFLAVDSVAALVPMQEVEDEIGQSKIGLQARLMSQAMRKMAPGVRKSNTALVFINQIRTSIGIVYGCFPYAAKVRLSDGSSMTIGKIVNQKLDVEVLSWNPTTETIEPKKVVGWYNNGKYEKLYTIETLSPHKSGKIKMTVADDHCFITKDGEKRLSEMSVGDLILTPSKTFLNKDQQSLILGGYLGDGSIRIKNGVTGRYREVHGVKQNDYCKWKSEMLGEFIAAKGYTSEKFWFESITSPELISYQKGKSRGLTSISEDIISKIDIIALAIWYLDDGTFSGSYTKWGSGKSNIYATNLPLEYKEKVIEHVSDKLGIKLGPSKNGFICSGSNNAVFHAKIAPYVPKCMSYKIHPKLRHLCETYTYNTQCDVKDVLIEVPILDLYEIERKNNTITNKFDIEVADNSNYFVSDILVHNSPEVVPGGNALKFYASLRIEVRRSTQIKDKKGAVVGNQIKAKVVKNKLAAPYRSCVYDILYGEGVSLEGEIIDVGSELGVVEKSGSWYSYEGTKIGQGKDSVREFLKDNPELAESIAARIREAIA